MRQLERRRVLDAALPGLIGASTVIVDSGATATSTDAAAEPLVFDWSATDAQATTNAEAQSGAPEAEQLPNQSPAETSALVSSASAVVGSAVEANLANDDTPRPASDLAAPPTIFVQPVSNVNEGSLLDLSGLVPGSPPLATYTGNVVSATVNWGDGTGDQVADFFNFGGGGFVSGTHTYADDGAYTITVTVTDDMGQTASGKGQAVVANVAPSLTDTDPVNVVNEGQAFVLSNLPGGTLPSLGIGLSDPGFDNPLNPTTPTIGDPFQETFTGYTIDWGDGTAETPVTIVFRDSGEPSVLTTALFEHAAHTYADNGVYTVTIRVADDNMSGNFTTGTNGVDFVDLTFTITVNNVPPTLDVPVVSDNTIDEGGSVSFTAAFSDPGFDNPLNTTDPSNGGELAESFTYDIDWGDGREAVVGASIADLNGSPGVPSTGQISGSHTYADNGTYTVTVTIHDDDGGSHSRTFQVIVANVAPTLAVPVVSDNTIDEGGSVSFTANFSDPGFDNPLNTTDPSNGEELAESFTYDIDWGDGRDAVVGASIADLNGGPSVNSTGQVSGNHTYADNGTYTVTVTIHDDDGGSHTQTFVVVVANVAPTLAAPVVSDNTIDEGGSVSFTANFSDPGFDNPLNTTDPSNGEELAESFTYDIDWGDGRDAVVGASIADLNGGPGVNSTGQVSGNHTYADNGTYTVTVTIHDDDGGSHTQTFVVVVANVAPTLAAPVVSDNTIDEGDSVSFTANFSDPGFDNPLNTLDPSNGGELAESFTYDIDWGDGRDAVVGASIADLNGSPGVPSTGQISGNHTYADNGTYTVTVTIHDDDGGSHTQTFVIVVANVAPTLAAPVVSDDTIDEGGNVSFTANFSDPGFDNPLNTTDPSNGGELAESFTYDIDWGDGREAVVGASIADLNGSPGVPSTGQISGSHTYADNGTYTVTVTIHDDDGGSHMQTFVVVVANVAPTLAAPVVSDNTIDEGGNVSFTADFSDPGFDNPLNTLDPSNGGELAESFTYDIDWGDGRDAVVGASIADLNGSPGVPSTGQISGNHTYADNGTYTVTVTIHDDDGGSHTQTFVVVVANVAPTLAVPVVSDNTIDEGGSVSFTADFSDPGFDNPLNTTDPSNGGELAESFTYDIDWGDGRDAVVGASVADLNGSPGVPSTGSFGGSHTYADNGTYTVTVTIHDDDGGSHTRTFQVIVANVAPSLTDVGPENVVNEGQAFVLSNLPGGTLPNLGLGISDPGFDNANNPTTPAIGDPFQETFTGYTIDWGDGTADTPVTIVLRDSGEPGVPTTALFQHAAHTYADNGVYTVRVRLADDNMSGNFTIGINGVDFIDLTFTITVNNVAPTLAAPVPTATTINENGSVSFSVSFTDPGFDNPLNANDPSNGGEVAETFTYDINWGDGRETVSAVGVDASAGAVGVPSAGSFGATHTYADDGTYTITVTIHDDDGGTHSQVFTVVVQNVAPSFVPLPGGAPFQGTDVTSDGLTTIGVSYTDPGFDNSANPNAAVPPSITDTHHESFTHLISWGDGTVDAIHTYANQGVYNVTVTVTGPDGTLTFAFSGLDSSLQPVLTLVSSQLINDPIAAQTFTYVVDWGDGNVQTMTLELKAPGVPLFNNGLTRVIADARTSGSAGVQTVGSFQVEHRYVGPPNPENPTADIQINVTIVDDNLGSTSGSILITNPGIDPGTWAIDTTPQVPRLNVAPPVSTQALLNQNQPTLLAFQSRDQRVASGTNTASVAYLELVVMSLDGENLGTYRLSDEALSDMRSLFRMLPDGRYQIFLVRPETNTRRLVMEVYVRRGFVVDPSDDSEGTRDRPPTSETPAEMGQIPLEENPLVQRVDAPQGEGDDAATRSSFKTLPLPPGEGWGEGELSKNKAPSPCPLPRGEGFETASNEAAPADAGAAANEDSAPVAARSLRWGASLAGLALVADQGDWSKRLEAALRNADAKAWQRLRRVARLGKNPSRRNHSIRAGKLNTLD